LKNASDAEPAAGGGPSLPFVIAGMALYSYPGCSFVSHRSVRGIAREYSRSAPTMQNVGKSSRCISLCERPKTSTPSIAASAMT
jgi:hypothetical protein